MELRPNEEDAKVETYSHHDLSSPVTISSERYQCMETLFNPGSGIVDLIMSVANAAGLTPLKDIWDWWWYLVYDGFCYAYDG